MMDDEINLLEYVAVLARRSKFIVKTVVIASFVSVAIALMLPNIYISTARVLPPEDKSGGMSSLLGGMGDLAALAGVSVRGGSGELWAGMLMSRTVSDAIIDRFDLMSVYNMEYRVKTYEELSKHVNIVIGEENGILSISVEDEDPQRAADMANAYLDELDRLNHRFNLLTAGRERIFLEDRLELVKKDLKKSEDALKFFQEKNKTFKIDQQAEATINAIAQLKAEEASKEVELRVLLAYQTENNPKVISTKEALETIRKEINKLNGGKESSIGQGIYLSIAAVPELGLQYARLMRNFKIQESLFESLTKQYEMAKIAEAKNSSMIQILDRGTVADKKSKPKRSIIVIVITMLASFGAVFWAFVREYTEQLTDEDLSLLVEIKWHLRSFIPVWFKK